MLKTIFHQLWIELLSLHQFRSPASVYHILRICLVHLLLLPSLPSRFYLVISQLFTQNTNKGSKWWHLKYQTQLYAFSFARIDGIHLILIICYGHGFYSLIDIDVSNIQKKNLANKGPFGAQELSIPIWECLWYCFGFLFVSAHKNLVYIEQLCKNSTNAQW